MTQKFKYAFSGLKVCLKDKSIVIQLILAIMAIVGGLIIRLDYYEWLAFIICIAMVVSFEIFNSIIEHLCDLYTKEINNKIKMIKDLGSAAVLFSSICALVICIICVLRRLL